MPTNILYYGVVRDYGAIPISLHRLFFTSYKRLKPAWRMSPCGQH